MNYDPDFPPPMDEGSSSSNPLGVVGFVLSFCTGPVGLIISLIALRKQPRGLAIAGVVIGSLTTLVGGCCGLAFYLVAPFVKPALTTVEHFGVVKSAVDVYYTKHDKRLPKSIDDLNLSTDSRLDGWGTQMRFEPGADGKSWKLVAASADKAFDTEDDMVLESGMTDQEVSEQVQDALRAHFGAPRLHHKR